MYIVEGSASFLASISMIKPIAFYLPQFHCIPENNEWWGEGFTEWTNVKKSKPLFKGHNQPEVPLSQNYYNLLDCETMINQAKIAKKYGVYGFCYYHYWFEGKLLLEKPLENMLVTPEIDMPFCMCWANESWARTWDGQETNVLIKQRYDDDENGWSKHFNYLFNFFNDPRYIKVDNKPMLIIYKPFLITNLKEMMIFWNKLAIENGFEGIYFGYQYPKSFDYDIVTRNFDFGIEFEPLYTNYEISKKTKMDKVKLCLKSSKAINHFFSLKFKKNNQPSIYNYDFIWSQILSRSPKEKNIMPGAFPAWDNSPRKGNNALVFYPATPEKFGKYIKSQVERAVKVYNSEYIFINAWNEWGEGAHLEPDEHNKFGYLEALEKAVDKYNNQD